MNNNLPKSVHVIGICGVATSALAVAFKKKGIRVTGSDKGFFPPVSTELENQGVTFYAGWHPEKMIENGLPDVVIVGTASGSQNPETELAREKNIPMYSFAEAIGKFFAKENTIVCSGTWGKTSSSAMLSYILDEAKMDPTYMFGGVSLSHDSSASLTDSKWAVFEGDEYKSSPTDTRAKFFHYKPTHLLLSAVSWDHADLYPTEAEYFAAFHKLLDLIPSFGFITGCIDHNGVRKTLDGFKGKIVWYGRDGSGAKYTYKNVTQDKTGLNLSIQIDGGEIWQVHSPMFGLYQAENITGVFAMACEVGVSPKVVVQAIAKFKGLKRRMEKRFDGDVAVIDDIAHSPEKASSVIATLERIYAGDIYVIFEPNSGGRKKEAAAKYDGAFSLADTVIIPRLTKLKVAADNSDSEPIDGAELAAIIAKTHKNTKYMDDDDALVDFLVSNTKKGDVIAFLGSHGFRGMIEAVVKKL